MSHGATTLYSACWLSYFARLQIWKKGEQTHEGKLTLI